jgi:hypothetical protein
MTSRVLWTSLAALRADTNACIAEAPVVAILPWLKKAPARCAAELMVSRAGAELTVLAVHDDLGAGPMAIWNCAVARTRGAFLIYCAEDAFAGRYWLRFALQAMQKPGAGLLAFNDGKWFGQLAAFGLVRREWIEPIYGGFLFNPEYAQHYGDTELTLIARQQQALVYHPHALLIEVDHAKDKRPVNAADHAIFQRRAATGFDHRVHDAALLALFAAPKIHQAN